MRAQTMQEYRDMISQALLEVEDLRRMADFEEAPVELGFADALQRELEALQTAAAAADYAFGESRLDFAALLQRHDVDELPFRHLLERIVRTHSAGLDEDGRERRGLEEVGCAS